MLTSPVLFSSGITDLGQGVVTRNSGNVIAGDWLAHGEGDHKVSVWHGDLRLRDISPTIEMPGSDRRGFQFELSADLIAMLPPAQLTIRDRLGNVLPEQAAQQTQLIGTSTDGGAQIRAMLSRGYYVDKWGALKLRFDADLENRREHREAMVRVADYFRDELRIPIFPHYGTLLGLARDNAFLDHDDDVDMSFYVRAKSLDDVVRAYLDVIERVEGDGHQIGSPSFGQFHVRLAGTESKPAVDIFLSWGLSELEFNTYFGVAGELSEPLRLVPARLEGATVLAPAQIEEVLTLTYGPSWRIPDPTFQWRNTERVGLVMYYLEKAATRAGHPPTHAAASRSQ